MDRLTSLAVFVKVAERGSFVAAAQALSLSPTMIAKHIRSLEERLGVTLIRRTTRRQSLTDMGQAYLERARLILSEVEAADNLMAESQSAPRGLLRLNAPATFGTTALAEALPDYLRSHPEVRIDLGITDRMVDLVEEGYDAVIRIGALADSSLRALTLTPYQLILCGAPDYLARHDPILHPRDLSAHNCLEFSHWNPRNQWQFKGSDGVYTVDISGSFRVNTGQALRMAAMKGLGVILQPQMLLRDDLKSGALVELLPQWRPAPRPLHLLTSPERRRSPKLTSFVHFMARQFPPHGG